MLLAGYLITSEWVGLDSRIPFAMASGVLAAAIVTYALGNRGASDAMAGYIFLLIAGGVILFLVDQARATRGVGTHSEPNAGPGARGPD